ncbi:MotA/TolQ/ExbB proton channel family protein [Lujinxingia sediminis]|uniref:MotA/TolQ/ExbB proton channel family protein n=1 Tax=Lujinxingia sediminis TaxID=2480984 RepID=A0ABY0CZ76_9DELT|nr:MotA/TolQ/ExbB proton channel family protein [Lujinxingia sediminis]RVU48876.1 MotA/TolQ/ExbB proton channel family protein [Lujinxingia sediminis]
MLTEILLDFALIGAEWVLWLLILLSFANIYVVIEKLRFFHQRKVDVHELRLKFEERLRADDFDAAAKLLEGNDAMEARVVLFGMRGLDRGPEAVEDLMNGAMASERTRYERLISLLATTGNNAPFIGLFGTVLGIIGAFAALGEASEEANQQVMAAISEALVATGVGLLVAIPAVIMFNVFRQRVKKSGAQTELMSRTLLAHLRRND